MSRLAPGGALDRSMSVSTADGTRKYDQSAARATVAWMHSTMARGDLWWFGDEMLALSEAVLDSVPGDHVFSPDDLPSPCGLAVFERPHLGIAADRDATVRVHAISWGPAHLAAHASDAPAGAPGVDAVCVTSWAALEPAEGMTGDDLQRWLSAGGVEEIQEQIGTKGFHMNGGTYSVTGTLWTPLGRTDWPLGFRLDEHADNLPEQYRASEEEDRRLLLSLMLVAGQPGVASVREERPPRPEARRSERKGRSATVKVVYLRRLDHSGTEDDSPPEERDEHGRVDWSCRWLVRPHFRSQPYGPGRSLRRTILVGPYVKGPEDKPLRRPTEVKAVVR